jgi:PAS domain S-box-containing protein
MAISIENARIHAELETLLESRSKALASAEAQVRTLFEDSPLGIALTSYEGRILTANRAVLEMLRITEEELLRHGVTDFYEQADDRGMLLKELEESGFVQDFGVQLLRHDGARFYASLNMSKLDLEGNEVLLAMVEDVTAQITAEQESAVLEERARMARELHDAVSQTILSASLLADATAHTAGEGRAIATEDLTSLSRMLRGALDELRTLLFELRPAALRGRTLGQMLGALTDTARARSLAAVNLEIKGDHVLPERVTMTLHRIAQESLNNAIKHAQATTIDVDLVCDPDEVVMRIVDDGLGFDHERSPAGHHGLDIMRERAEEIGAVLEIESRAGSGTQVTATWS